MKNWPTNWLIHSLSYLGLLLVVSLTHTQYSPTLIPSKLTGKTTKIKNKLTKKKKAVKFS